MTCTKEKIKKSAIYTITVACGLAVAFSTTGASAQPVERTIRRPIVIIPTPPPATSPPGPSLRAPVATTGSLNVAIPYQQNTIRLTEVAREKLLASTTMDEFILNIPNQQSPRNDRNVPKGAAESGEEAAREGNRQRNYGVTRQNFSLSKTPNEIVTFEPVAGFWLGSILEEQGLRGGLGSQREVPILASSRANYLVSVNSLAIPNSYREITSPSMSTVNAAIGSMIQSAGNAEVGTAMSMNVVENYNASQTALSLNLDASYIGARVKAALTSNSSASRQAVTLSFVQRAFTVSMDTQGRNRAPAFFNDTFTLDQAKELVTQGRLGVTADVVLPDYNPPNYIKSITYGRAILINVVSNIDRSDLKTFLSGSYSSGAFAVDVSAGLQNQRQNERFEMQVTTFGGPGSALNKLVVPLNSRDDLLRALNSYLRAPAPLTTMVPISYAAYSLRDDRLATIQRTTEYTVTTYSPQPMGKKVTLNIRFIPQGGDGAGDSTNELFGTVRINNQIVSQISRAEADGNGRENGQSLDLKMVNAPNTPITVDWYFGDPEPIIEVEMWDADSGSGDDWLYKKRFTLSMAGLANSDTAQVVDNQYSPDQGATSTVIIDLVKTSDM
jgi:Thiol-activated cytolysin